MEIKEPVTIVADAALEKQTKRSSAELLEIELDIGEFVLLSIKDPKLKASVSSALLTVDALTEHSPFCRYWPVTQVRPRDPGRVRAAQRTGTGRGQEADDCQGPEGFPVPLEGLHLGD